MRSLRDVNLNSLRIVESAARLKSFTLAGEEQFITPSAVSQRIKKLEEQLEFQIFRRKNRSITLTHEGEEFVVRIKQALDDILSAGLEVQESGRDNEILHLNILPASTPRWLKISILPTFASRWLLARIPSFQAQNPNIALNISTSYAATNFSTNACDLAIRYGTGNFAGLYERLLFKENLIPVCTPEIMRSIKAAANTKQLMPQSLVHGTLLHSDTCTANWRSWLKQNDALEVLPQARAVTFDSCMLCVEGAIAGMGVAVANKAYVQNELANGKLTALFDTQLTNENGWYIVYPPQNSAHEDIVKFEEWLFEQVATSPN